MSHKITSDLIGFAGRVIWTNGCFDGLHPGHVHTLQWAKSQGDTLIVGVNRDVAKIKGRERFTFNGRAESLAALSCVDWVVPFDDATPINIIRIIRPALIVKGYDYAGKAVVGSEIAPVAIAPPCDFMLHSSDLYDEAVR